MLPRKNTIVFSFAFLVAICIRVGSCTEEVLILNNQPNLLKRDKENTPNPKDSSIIHALAKHANKNILTEECFMHFKAIESGISKGEPWAIKVKDSSGEKEPGFIWGNTFWLGRKQGCAAVQEPLPLTLSPFFNRTMKEGLISQIAPFKMEFRVVYLEHNSPWLIETMLIDKKIINIGLCLPSSCSSSEIHYLTQSLLDNNLMEANEAFELNAKVIKVKDLKLSSSFFKQKTFKFTIGLVILTVLLTIAAWFLKDSKSMPLVECFDIVQNTQELFTLVEPSPNHIPVIHGLKSLACNWIIFYHVFLYMFFMINNKSFLFSSLEKTIFQPLAITPLFVDLLFVVSGFLQAYLFLYKESNLITIRKKSLPQNAQLFLFIVFQRYLRLGTLYFIVAIMTTLFTSYAQDVSMFHITEPYDQVCSKYWWRHGLFIQNFFEFKDLCLNWSWSLACEMQFFWVGLVLLFIYAKNPQMAKKLTIAIIIATITYTYVVALKINYNFAFDMGVLSLDHMYINPIVRITPYLVGTIGGWYLAVGKGNLKFKPSTENMMWKLTNLIFFGCMYSNMSRDMSSFSSISLLVGSRVLIGLASCWMLIASATGSKTWWSRILEWKFFQSIGRLSYAIYLLNPFLIAIVFSLSDISSYADPFQLGVLMAGFCVITYFVSIVFYLAFEVPVSKMSILLLRKNTKTA